MSSANARLFVLLAENTSEGTFFRRIHDLHLMQSHLPLFVMPWTLLHVIDEASPLFGHHAETLAGSDTRLFLALEARDQHCVFEGCDRRRSWCDGHHLVWWIKGGPTTLTNLALLCRPHHRMVHEEGWTLERRDGTFKAIPPVRRVRPSSRST